MSRTDAHRPPLVWLNDHPNLVVEIHDHRNGPCDLPVAPFTDAHLPWPSGRSCYVTLDPLVRVCGCGLCTGRPWRRHTTRSGRAAARTLLRAAACGESDETLELLEAKTISRARY